MTHYLTRVKLNRNAPEQALTPLLDPVDKNAALDVHHRLMWTLFPDRTAKRDYLWRADGKGRFLILSARQPQQSRLFNPLETKIFDPVLAAGDQLSFLLRANATKDRRSSLGENVVPGTLRKPIKDRRVDIVMHAMHQKRIEPSKTGAEGRSHQRMQIAKGAAQDWLSNLGERRGFEVNNLAVDNYRVLKLKRRRGISANFGILDISGWLTVREPDLFIKALLTGFGRAKAYGCGLMLVRRI